MKKCFALMLVLVMMLSAIPVFAAGKLIVTQENFHIVDTILGNKAYGYAKVENVGDRAIEVNSALLEIYDKDGEALPSSVSYQAYPKYLQPGEYTYVLLESNVDKIVHDINDYSLTVVGKSNNEYYSLRYPFTNSYFELIQNGFLKSNYMYATITNNSDKTLFDFKIVMVLLDEEGNILYMNHNYFTDIALTPGSSCTFRSLVSEDRMKYFELNKLKPATVDVIAYVNIQN